MRGNEEGYDRSPVEDLAWDIGNEGQEEVRFFVAGEPQPKGSTHSFYVKKLNRVVTTSTNRNLKQWQIRIATEAQRINEGREVSFYDPDKKCGYKVEVHFLFCKPKSAPKKIRLNTKRPDLDKLVRAVLDGLADILIPDDSQVLSIMATKRYIEGNETPGVQVILKKIH